MKDRFRSDTQKGHINSNGGDANPGGWRKMRLKSSAMGQSSQNKNEDHHPPFRFPRLPKVGVFVTLQGARHGLQCVRGV